jgi:hypothetical protein
MACYEYMCFFGHVCELNVKYEDRPDMVWCPKCYNENVALYVVSAVPTTFRLHDRKAFKKRGGK